MKDLEAIEGTNIELASVLSDCYPIPQVQWKKDEQAITESTEHITIQSENSQQKLTVVTSVEADEGKYVLAANNELGATETSCQVKVLCKK